jgi:NhaC family Na+:H+ antiporter
MSLYDGYVATTGVAAVDELLSAGGMSSMLTTIWLILTRLVLVLYSNTRACCNA